MRIKIYIKILSIKRLKNFGGSDGEQLERNMLLE